MNVQGPAAAENHHWDHCIKSILPKLETYQLVSFDIFDTLLFRTCYAPEDIFAQAGAAYLQKNPSFVYAPETYRKLRIEAENRARQRWWDSTNSREILYSDIFDELPFPAKTRQHLARLEYEAECAAVYLNPSVYAFLRHCKALGKIIVLTSNMYYGADQMRALLSGAGFDCALADGYYISCEHGKGKDAGLFEVILQDYPSVLPAQLLHIGDMPSTDVYPAKAAGMDALHYAVVPGAFGDIYQVEKELYGCDLGSIASLRKLCAASAPYDDAHSATFYKLGAEVFGPVYTLFCEWLLALAKTLDCKTILPFMREGELLGRLINNSINHARADCRCVPFSISRHVAFAASLYDDNLAEKLHGIAYLMNCTATDLLAEVGLDITTTPLTAIEGSTMEQLRADDSLASLLSYLENERKEDILAYAQEQRALLLQLLQQLCGGAGAMTADLGTRATTNGYLDEILRRENRPPLTHALMLGADAKNVANILDGMRLYGYLGIAGKNSEEISRIIYALTVLEMLLNATCGTVLRYKRTADGPVESVLDEKRTSAAEDAYIAACWQGIEDFQSAFFELDDRKNLLPALLQQPDDVLGILLRFLEMPTTAEASAIALLKYYDVWTAKDPMALSNLTLDPALDDGAIDRLLSSSSVEASIWPQGAVALQCPSYFPGKFIKAAKGNTGIAAMYQLALALHEKKHSKIAVFAVSENGRTFVQIAQALALPLACFIDNNETLQGSSVLGLPVRALSELESGVDAIVISSYYYAKEIRAQLESYYNNAPFAPSIYDFNL